MSVHVLYRGRVGNHLFQYISARLFAERNGLRLATPFTHPEIVRMAPQGEPMADPGPETRIRDDEDVFGYRRPGGRYIFDGYFQNSEWYHAARSEIEAFAVPEPQIIEMNREDIVMNVRLGDYRTLGWVIDPSWYLEILSREQFKRLHIVTDEPDPSYLSHFRKFEPTIISSGPTGDWAYLRSFDRMVCSNSTFCWWAAFFSKASRIYTFKKWVGRPEVRLGPFPNGIEVDGTFM